MHRENPSTGRQAAKNEAPAKSPEHIALISDVVAYLKASIERRYPDDESRQEQERKRLCPSAMVCNLWPLEPAFEKELGEARLEGKPDKINQVRHLLYGLSWRSHGRPDEKELYRDAETLKRRAEQAAQLAAQEKKQHERHKRFDREDDWHEIVEQAETIERAVADRKLSGAELEPATEAVEDFMGRAYRDLHHAMERAGVSEEALYRLLPKGQDLIDKDLEVHLIHLPRYLQEAIRRVGGLRQLRDELYFRRLYPEQYLQNAA